MGCIFLLGLGWDLLVLVAGLEGFVFDLVWVGFCVVLVVGLFGDLFLLFIWVCRLFYVFMVISDVGFCWWVGGFDWLCLVGFVFRCLSFLLVCMGLGLWVWGCLFGG